MDLELTLQTTTMKSTTHVQPVPVVMQQPSPATSSDWREQLPVLTASGITLRELRTSDAPALASALRDALDRALQHRLVLRWQLGEAPARGGEVAAAGA